MTDLQAYVRGKQSTLTALAQRAKTSTAQLSRIATGRSRPSPDLARRIEAATEGEVTAASLLGVSEGGRTQKRRDGKWLVEVDANGRAYLPAELLADFGVGPGDPLVLARTETGFRASSMRQAIRLMQESLRPSLQPGESVVDELIAERRAEAARD